MDRTRIKKASQDVLRAIVIGTALLIICSSPSGTRRLLKGVKKEWNKRSVRLAVERLRRKKLIDYQEMPDGTVHVVATKQGKNVIRQIDINNMSIEKPARWDKKWRLVAFDISEERKKGREALRGVLYRLGFYKLQKSIFIYRKLNLEVQL